MSNVPDFGTIDPPIGIRVSPAEVGIYCRKAAVACGDNAAEPE